MRIGARRNKNGVGKRIQSMLKDIGAEILSFDQAAMG